MKIAANITDGGISKEKTTSSNNTAQNVTRRSAYFESEVLDSLNANNIYQKNQIDRFTKFSRFGFFDPYNTNTVTREYIFFTKMDLHLFTMNKRTLNPEIANIPFFVEAAKNHRDTMNQLQKSSGDNVKSGPFCNLLSNTVASRLELRDIDIDVVETAATINGIKLEYPLPIATSSNIFEFSLEFEDTKNLDVYMFFRIWYEYELLKQQGMISPPDQSYIINKILHDQMCCYKIVVGEDMETIIHYSKLWGVYPTSIPRSVFGDLSDGPIKIPISFKCQFIEDMDPMILSDFNKVVQEKKSRYSKDINIYNSSKSMMNGQWCNIPYIISSTLNDRRVYKLKWR